MARRAPPPSSPLPQLLDPCPRPVLSHLQTSDMHPEEELDAGSGGVEIVICLLIRPLFTLVALLPAMFWALLVCSLSDALTYARGY